MPRLKKSDWDIIEKLIRNKSKTITQISQFYGISRHSLYCFAWRRGWLKKKDKSLWSKIFEK